jgi:hypothetical protein
MIVNLLQTTFIICINIIHKKIYYTQIILVTIYINLSHNIKIYYLNIVKISVNIAVDLIKIKSIYINILLNVHTILMKIKINIK